MKRSQRKSPNYINNNDVFLKRKTNSMILLINSCIINRLTNHDTHVKDKNHKFLHMPNSFYFYVSRT